MEEGIFMHLRKGRNIYIKQPEFNELEFVKWLWADYETMRDVGGPINLEDSRKEVWYQKMVKPTDGKNFYCLIYNNEDTPVGEVSFHKFDSKDGKAELNIKIANKYRGNGYAKEAVTLILMYFFNEFGGNVMIDGVAINNLPGQTLLMNYGFKRINTDDNVFLLEMAKEEFMEMYVK